MTAGSGRLRAAVSYLARRLLHALTELGHCYVSVHVPEHAQRRHEEQAWHDLVRRLRETGPGNAEPRLDDLHHRR